MYTLLKYIANVQKLYSHFIIINILRLYIKFLEAASTQEWVCLLRLHLSMLINCSASHMCFTNISSNRFCACLDVSNIYNFGLLKKLCLSIVFKESSNKPHSPNLCRTTCQLWHFLYLIICCSTSRAVLFICYLSIAPYITKEYITAIAICQLWGYDN